MGPIPGARRASRVRRPDKADLVEYPYNDLEGAEAAAARAEGDVAAIIVTPFKHDSFEDQELVDPRFARGLRALGDRVGAALVIDDVRAGFRLDPRGSWEPLGVRPDLTAWSKAIANGYPMRPSPGRTRSAGGGADLYSTGSFWFSAVAMAAAMATIETLARPAGRPRWSGRPAAPGRIASEASSHGVAIRQTGPVQIPCLSFAGDENLERGMVSPASAACRGVFLHPSHNWFLSSAHTEDDVDRTLEAMGHAFARVAAELGTV